MNVHLGNLLPTLINNVLPIHNTSLFTLMYKENVLFAIEILHRNYSNLVSRRQTVKYCIWDVHWYIIRNFVQKTKAYNKINNNISLSKLLCFCGIMLLRFQHFVVKTKHVFKSFKHQCATKSILSILRQDITSCPTYYSLSHHSKRGQSDLFIYLYYITAVPKSNKCYDTVFK